MADTTPTPTAQLRPGWHACADCASCDGTAERHCSWSHYCGGIGHQDAACQHDPPARLAGETVDTPAPSL